MRNVYSNPLFTSLLIFLLGMGFSMGQGIDPYMYRIQSNVKQLSNNKEVEQMKRDYEKPQLSFPIDESSLRTTAVSPEFLTVNCQKLWINGSNVAWKDFASDVGGSGVNAAYFDQMFKNVKAAGGNSMRWWLHTNASFSPDINSNGFCTGISASAIQDVKTVLDLAQKNGVVLDLCLFSFDMLQKEYHMSDANNLKFLTSKANIQSYIDNALTPLVNAVKDHPAIWCWEVFNEPEGMTNEFGWTGVQPATGAFVKGLRCNMSDIQRGVNMIAGAIHRLDKNNPVTNGTYAFMSLSDTKWTTDTRAKNYYRDDRLIAAGGDKDGTLDFYEVHYYESSFGLPQSPFNHDKSYWGLDKPVVVAEFYVQDTYGVNAADLFNELYNRGYAGGLGWHYLDKWAEIQTGVSAAYNAHKSDIAINVNACNSAAPVLSWDFNTAGDMEGWNMTHNVTGIANGFSLATTTTGADPYILSPGSLNATASQYKYVYINIRNYTSQTQGELYWTTNKSGSFDATKHMLFDLPPNDGQYHDVLIDLSSIGAWADIITQLRVDPMATGNSGEIRFNHISFETTNKLDCAGIWAGTTSQVLPTVAIAQIAGTNPSCLGNSVSFTATLTNGGSTPIYQWKSNGNNVGTNGATYTSTTVSDGAILTCVMISNAQCASTAKVTSNAITIKRTALVTPSVSIAQTSGANPSCANESVTFTATRTNGGSNPSYQWKVDGVNQGTSSTTFTSNALVNDAAIICVLTTNVQCASSTMATSTAIKVSRNAIVTPTMAIAQTTGSNPSCGGDVLAFTATQTNGGVIPSYQWKVDGVNQGANAAIFTSNTLANNVSVTCVLTSNATCINAQTVTSNAIKVQRNAIVLPTVIITQTFGSNPSCLGDSLSFMAKQTNGGSSPSYQWKSNGFNVGTNSPIYNSKTLSNGAALTCVMTSNAQCTSISKMTSNAITITRSALVTPTISIAQTDGNNPSCTSESLTFTATQTNGGASPSFQWNVDGINQGTHAATFISSALANNANVTCLLASNATCAAINTASSNVVTIQRTATVTPTISIAATAGTSASCTGQALTFISTPTNGGTTPSYQWNVDGNNQGMNAATFTTTTLANNAKVTCVMTSTVSCASNPIATSNTITQVVKSKPIANAGSDKAVENNTSFNLEGNTLEIGETGLWTTTSAGIIATPTSPTSSVSGLLNVTGTFRWIVSNGGCSVYDEVLIHAGFSPSVVDIIGETNVLAGVTYTYSVTPQADESYGWIVSPGATITSNMGNSIQVVFDAGFSGTISLTIINSFGIAQMHTDVESAVSTGIYSSNANKVVALAYPTPFSDVVHVEVESAQTEPMHVTVTDMSGKQVFVSDAYQTNELFELGVELSNGMYILQAHFGSKISVVKIVKQNK